MPIKIDFNRSYQYLNLQQSEIDQLKLIDLYKRVSELTNIPLDNVKLAHCGVPMNDKSATLNQYQINENSDLIFVGNLIGDFKDNNKLEDEEKSLMLKVKSTVDDMLNQIHSEIDQYPIQINQYLKSNYSPSNQQAELKKLNDQYMKLSELILQTILKLDLIENSKNFGGVRDERKKAILNLNNILAQLDAAKSKL